MQTEQPKPTAESLPDLAELRANPLVIELHQSFAGFFTYEECFKSLKSCDNSVEEAARWLVDEGEKDRGKKALVSLRRVMIAESELHQSPTITAILKAPPDESMPVPGMPPGGKHPGGDVEFIVKKGSVL